MMKGIRGLLEKDFRLFLRQGGNLFLVLAVVAIFSILTGKMGADFIAVHPLFLYHSLNMPIAPSAEIISAVIFNLRQRLLL